MMKELKEIRFNESNIQLQDHLVKGSILPEKASELNRCITIQGNTIIEGPVYAHKLEIQNGDLEIQGAVFTQLELYINSDAQGAICFKKSVGSANAVVSRAAKVNPLFYSDLNAKSVTLYNAFIAGSIYADEIVLDNCVAWWDTFERVKLSSAHTLNTVSRNQPQYADLFLHHGFVHTAGNSRCRFGFCQIGEGFTDRRMGDINIRRTGLLA